MELDNSDWASDLVKSKGALGVRLHHEMGVKKLMTPTRLMAWKGPI
jgi:hypothetical protein